MPEVGYQTTPLLSWGSLGAADEGEVNPLLQWPKNLEVYDRMRREDAQVGSVLSAVTLPIRRTKWMLDPAGCKPEVVKLIATDLGLPVKGEPDKAPLRTKGRFSFAEHLRLALLELPHGHSVFEMVFDQSSGQARLAKLAWRPPLTISEWKVARDGGLEGIHQHDVKQLIPVDRLVVYVKDREGGVWTGQSLLRTCYKPWILKDRVLRAQAITVERNGLGVPVYTGAEVPENATPEEREAWLKSEKDAGLKVATEFRSGEQAGASIPHSATLELKGVMGKLPDTDKPIRYYDEQIARAVLAHFLNLGTETGSWALGSTFANFFTESLNALAAHIADVLNQHVVEDLVDANWGPTEPAPRVVAAAIGEEQPATAEAVKALIEAGLFAPDPALEAFMRAKYGLPVRDPNWEPPAPAVPAPEVDPEADPDPAEEAS